MIGGIIPDSPIQFQEKLTTAAFEVPSLSV